MTTAVCVMTKAPVAGRVKTRLCPPLSADDAARLSAAFALDTWRAAGAVGDAVVLLAWAGDRDDFPAPLCSAEGFAQAGADLGARIEHAARLGLQRSDRVLVIGGDAPALPPALLQRAVSALDRADAVLGPALDGGYYLLGLRRCEPGLLRDLPWSAPDTFEATRARLQQRGQCVATLPVWFDVDDADGLALLRLAIRAGAIDAPATAAVMEQLP